MKTIKLMLIFVLSTVLFCSCSKAEKNGDSALAFPETKWEMNAREVLDAYGLTKDDVKGYSEAGRGVSFYLENQELFGTEASNITFAFANLKRNSSGDFPAYEEGELGPDEVLCTVQVTYPNDADFDTIYKNMKKAYGKSLPELTSYSLFSAFSPTGNLVPHMEKESEYTKIWAEVPVSKLIPTEESDDYRNLWIDYLPDLSPENWEEVSQNSPSVSIVLTKTDDYFGITYDACNLAVYKELQSQLADASR